jgi:hypothetical protein
MLALFVTAALALSPTDTSDCICDWHEEIIDTTTYSRTFFSVIGSGFGLWGSTKQCKKSHVHKWTYDYTGPGTPPTTTGSTQLDLTSGITGTAPFLATQVQPYHIFRFMRAESPCAGDLKLPESDVQPEMLTFIALDGTSYGLRFSSASGTLASFLGDAYDPNEYDPRYVDSSLWLGIKTKIASSALLAPTLTWSTGSNPTVPVNATMDLSSPDMKTLALSLGSGAASLPYTVLVSSTWQDNGTLGVVDGVQIPLIFDATTAAFLSSYSLTGTTDSSGAASISFPTISGTHADTKDLSIAVVVHNATTGAVVKASTFVGLSLRDLSYCP